MEEMGKEEKREGFEMDEDGEKQRKNGVKIQLEMGEEERGV